MTVSNRSFHVFDARVFDAHIRQRQHAHRFAKEACFFAVAVDQHVAARRFQDCQRNTRQTCAGTDVGDRFATHETRDGQRIEHMAIDHFADFAHGGEVVRRIPAKQQFDVVEQGFDLIRSRRQAEFGHARFEAGI